MTAQSTIEQQNQSIQKSNAICNIVVLYDYNPDTKKGKLIPTDKIYSITIKENIFGKLPTLDLKLSDSGTYFNILGFKPGVKIFVKFTPQINDENATPPIPYLECVFSVQTFRYTPDVDTGACAYELCGIYDAPKYLSDICLWPTNNTVAKLDTNIDRKYTTKTLVPIIANQAGLKGNAVMDGETNDSMTWLNSNMTYSQFIKKLVNHAWVATDDAPIYYITRDGSFIYTTIKTLCAAAKKADYIEVSKYQTMFKKDGTTDKYYRTYRDAIIDNFSYLQDDGGNINKAYIYNPDKPSNVDKAINKHKTVPGKWIASSTYRLYSTENDNTKEQFSGVSNSNVETMDSVRYISNDMHFIGNHQYYDAAPMHNMNIIRKFFQIFTYLTVDINNQVNVDATAKQRPNIGDKIMIDFSSIYDNETIQSGEFIITGISHNYRAGHSYTSVITGVRDTITSIRE